MDQEKVIPNTDKPAYPTNARMHSDAQGLTKRELFAMAAMQAMIQVKGKELEAPTYHFTKNTEDVCGDIAAASIRVADEALKQLEK